ncbi:hypothetical protein RJT34_17015 [Clitoria ternatea]|uniref:Uncharacterized protein n=1 Tax=Clitoria ternatea TaxID=43366 RepID=A0AAN9J856_CLITE
MEGENLHPTMGEEKEKREAMVEDATIINNEPTFLSLNNKIGFVMGITNNHESEFVFGTISSGSERFRVKETNNVKKRNESTIVQDLSSSSLIKHSFFVSFFDSTIFYAARGKLVKIKALYKSSKGIKEEKKVGMKKMKNVFTFAKPKPPKSITTTPELHTTPNILIGEVALKNCPILVGTRFLQEIIRAASNVIGYNIFDEICNALS